VESYAGGISVQMDKLEEIVAGLDPTNPEAIGEAFNEGMFTPENTPAQRAALARLEAILALIEGWVDEVAGAAAAEHLAAAPQLREAVRRRRASGGPAEQTFGTLVGLELRPRRLRDAAELWHRLTEARGIDGRDAIWAHPDLLPTTEDLDDPAAFVAGKELDISSLLDGTLGEAPPEGELPGGDLGSETGDDEGK